VPSADRSRETVRMTTLFFFLSPYGQRSIGRGRVGGETCRSSTGGRGRWGGMTLKGIERTAPPAQEIPVRASMPTPDKHAFVCHDVIPFNNNNISSPRIPTRRVTYGQPCYKDVRWIFFSFFPSPKRTQTQPVFIDTAGC